MREFVFTLEYDPGTNPVADVLARDPETTVRSLSCHVTAQSLWRVDHATGTPDGLDALEDAYQEAAYCADCLVRDDCGADCETQVLDRTAETLIVYTAWDRTADCTSVPHVALEYLGPGLLFETFREERRYRWRIVLPESTLVGAFFEALENEIDECTGMDVLRLTDLDPGEHREESASGLPPAQQAALQAAVEHGYYETPRAIELTELAALLEIPRSTLSYRLRRAEAQLATNCVERAAPLESFPSGL